MAKPQEKEEKTRLLRLPQKLDKKIMERASKNHRSVTAQIIFELEQQP